MDLAKAADLVLASTSTLKGFRSDARWDHIYSYVKDVANLHGIKVEIPRPFHRQHLQQRLQDGVVLESTGVRAVVSTSLSDHYKRTLYFPVLDAILTQLERRFSSKNLMHMRAVQAFAPHSPRFLDPN